MIDAITLSIQAWVDALNPQQYQHFHFLRPAWLLMVLPLAFIYRRLTRPGDTLAYWRQNMSATMLQNLTIPGDQDRWLSPYRLYIPMGLLSVLILAGPSWQQQPSPLVTDQSTLVIALDVSDTMNQNDIQPTRLLRAKHKVNQLLDLRGDARTALMVYGGSAHVAMPVTDDRAMIRHFLDVLDSSILPVKGKQPQTVLNKAQPLFAHSATPGTLLIIGDGTNQDAIERYGAFFDDHPHQLIVWGIGQSSGRGQEGWQPMQEDELRAMARAGGGRLVTFEHDEDDVEEVNDLINNQLVFVDDESQPWYDAGYPLLFVIAALHLLWFRRGWSLQW